MTDSQNLDYDNPGSTSAENDENFQKQFSTVDNLSASTASMAKQEYRIHRKEVEGSLLEVVPEEISTSPNKTAEPENSARLPSTSQSASYSVDADGTPVQFHIPDSNMSEAGYSDISESVFYPSQVFTRAETLSAKQQVALWLTRTSMSDLKSFPSLKNLVQSGSGKSSSEKSKKKMSKNFFSRADSTKSFCAENNSQVSGSNERDQMMPSPIRKCETVIALSGFGGSGKTKASESAYHSCVQSPGTTASGPCCPSATVPFNLFARMSYDNRSGRRHPPSVCGTATPHARSIVSGCESPYPGIKPVNRLRSTPSMMCSRCTSVMSVNASRMTSRATSQLSLFQGNRRLSSNVATTSGDDPREPDVMCKICLLENSPKEMTTLTSCGCQFCKDCMTQYITFEVMSGSYDISCPDPDCEHQGVLQTSEIEAISGKEVADKHRKFRLNTEVALDKNRAWCPQANCETICHICSSASIGSPVEVTCPSCQKSFCSNCSSNWHPGLSCEDHGKALVKRVGTSTSMSAMFGPGGDSVVIIGGIEIKRCPMCQVPIERDTGCAQMMCKRCKHVFCWYCLQSLDDDFLLRHYDSGACKGQLGHSRASVLWHRAQVIGIFAAFGLLLLMASPCLLVVAPCVLCCGYKSCKNANSNKKGSE